MENLSILCENMLIKITNDNDGNIVIELPPDEKTIKPQIVDENECLSKQHYYQSFFGPTLDETLLVGCETIRDSNNWDKQELESVWGIETETTFSGEERREDSNSTFKVDNDGQLSEIDIDETETNSRSKSSSMSSTSSTSTTTSFKTSHYVSDENISSRESISSSLKKQTYSSTHFIPEESFTTFKKEFYCKPKQKQEWKVKTNEFSVFSALNDSYIGKSVPELQPSYCVTVTLTDNKSKEFGSKESKSNSSRASSKKAKEKQNNKESQNFSSLPEPEAPSPSVNSNSNSTGFNNAPKKYSLPEVVDSSSQRMGSSGKRCSVTDLNIAKEATEKCKNVSKDIKNVGRPGRRGYRKKTKKVPRLSAGGKSLPGIGGYTLFERMLSSIKNSRRQQELYNTISRMRTIKGCFMLCPGCEKKVKPLIRKQKPIPSDVSIGELRELLLRSWPFCFLFPLQRKSSVDLCCPYCTLELGVYDTAARKCVQYQWERSKSSFIKNL